MLARLTDTLGLGDAVEEAKRIYHKPRQAVHSLFNVVCIVLSAFVIWRSLMLVTGCESPIVVVLSGSMEPGMARGDLLFLHKPATFAAGDIVVYKVEGRDIPIVHRVISLHERANETFLLTKGDNNQINDRGLYAENQLWLRDSEIIGKAFAVFPHVGILTIWLNDHQSAKVIMLGISALLLFLGKDI